MIVPNVIYLQIDSEQDDLVDPFEGTTWCTDKINTGDIEYVRADSVGTKTYGTPLEKWNKVILALQELYEEYHSESSQGHCDLFTRLVEAYDRWLST